MSKSLLQRNARYLLTWLPVVLLVCSLAFYVMLRMQAHHMQEKQLELKQRNVWNTFLSKKGNIETHIEGEYDIIESAANLTPLATTGDTSIYYSDKKQSLPFQWLRAVYSEDGENYQLTTYVSSTEISHLIIKVFIAELVILLALLIAIVYLNKKSSGFLWKPFFSSVLKLKEYDIKGNQAISLPEETGTTEFDQLNRTASALIQNSYSAYHQQKEFVENASHEIQTPLAIIRSKLELLINQPNLTEKQASLLGDITDANDRLSQLNRTLLLLAKIGNNQFPGTESVNISEMIPQIILGFKNYYEDFPDLDENISNDFVVTASRSLIEILISNLAKNAIVHNLPEGRISIALSQSTLIICNTGSALDIPPDDLFHRFKKGSPTSKTTGLGLAIVKQICDLYQYKISYHYGNGMHSVSVNFS